MIITWRQLKPCQRGMALALGKAPRGVCENCGKERMPKSFPVAFPIPPYAGMVCSDCWKKFRDKQSETVVPNTDIFFVWHGKECVAPSNTFFERLNSSTLSWSVVEHYNNIGFITLLQYEAAIALSERSSKSNYENKTTPSDYSPQWIGGCN